MPNRVREILLVSSQYDAFVLEEDGPLTERLFTGYSELNLSSAPRITHVSTAFDALSLLDQQRYDLVITVVRVEDSDAADLSARVKDRHPDVPVALLIFDDADLQHFEGGEPPETIERTFLWTGGADTLLAAIKLIEDLRNVEHDTQLAGVQVILVVEDNIRAYSTFLALLYPELMTHSQSLIQEGYNDLQRLLRMRARPKILLANDLEEARVWLRWFGDRLMALISDVRFPVAGQEQEDAGFELAVEAREKAIDLPVLFLSAEENVRERARELDAWCVRKGSKAFAPRVRRFLTEALGFGDFVFRLPDGTEVGRARNVYEMEQQMKTVPIESVGHHAARHDFSVWLRARSMFDLANEIRPKTVDDFDHADEIRKYMVDVLQRARDNEQEGTITDVIAPPTGSENRFVRVGRGSMGGKGRGIAFVNSLIVRHGLLRYFEGLKIRIPKTVVLGTDAFERFVDKSSDLLDYEDDDPELERWLKADFDSDLERDLDAACRALKGPLAVRSSSVQEDSRFQPFAGVYATYMLPNNHPHPHIRQQELLRAIKAVYASMYSREARQYLAGTPHVVEDQRMAVVVQQVVGQRFGRRFYPLLSGVAQSRNYYPLDAQRSEEGVAVVVLGLGEMVVRGGTGLRFSPGSPRVLPQFPDDRAFLRLSQTQFYAVDLTDPEVDLGAGHTASLRLCNLEDAEEDGTLQAIGSVYSTADNVIRDSFNVAGPRVVTFNNVLRWNEFPLAEALQTLLELLRDAMGGEVEIEFAVDSQGWDDREPRLYVLQLRPMPPYDHSPLRVDLDHVDPVRLLVETHRALGHGVVEDIRDVVYVHRRDLDAKRTRAAALQIREVTRMLHEEDRRYLLVGPGRWGTSDPALGVPVTWQDIGGAKVIVETAISGRHVEPSQGSHFFHNLTARRMGYLTVEEGAGARLDQEWLDGLPAAQETELVRHVQTELPFVVQMDGLEGHAVVLKPSRR